jgi:O-antigen ligase
MLFGQLPFKYHASSDILPIVSGFLVTYILATKQRKSIVNFLVITTLLIFIVFLTGVRGVVLAIILTLLALYIKDKLFIIIILSVLLAGALTASYYLLPMIVERSLVDVSYFNIAYRLLAWKEVVYQSVQNNLLIEFGYIFDLNNIHYFFPYAASFNVNPHNSYLMLLFRSGVIGLLIVLWLLKDVFLLKEITISSTIVIFLSFVALTTPVFELHYLGPLFWLFMGMHFSYIHSRRQSG